MPIILDVSTCEICKQVITTSDIAFCSWWGAVEGFINGIADSTLTNYEDAPLHWHCYETSSVRKQLVQCNLARTLHHIQRNYFEWKIIRVNEPFYFLLINTTKEKVKLVSMDIVSAIEIELTNWNETINRLNPAIDFKWQIERYVWTEFLPIIRHEFPTKESLLYAATAN